MEESELEHIKELIDSGNVELALALIEGAGLDETKVIVDIFKRYHIISEGYNVINFKVAKLIQNHNTLNYTVWIKGGHKQRFWSIPYGVESDLYNACKFIIYKLKNI